MKKTEYKTVLLKQAVLSLRGAEKFTNAVTEELNEISAELGAEGWELATMFAGEMGCFAVFKREV